MLKFKKNNSQAQAYFQIFKSGTGFWYWHLKGANHKIMTQSEGYESRSHAQRAVHRFRDIVATAGIKEG